MTKKSKSNQFYFRATWRGLYLVLAISIIVPPFVLMTKSRGEQPLLAGGIEDGEDQFDHFRLIETLLASYDGNGKKRLSAEADKIIHRNRFAGLFAYYNLKEIFISGLKVELYPREQLPQDGSDLISSSFKDIGDRFLPIVGVQPISEEYPNNLDAELDILTRITVEDLLMTINLPERTKVVISSEMALINLHGITFQGRFSLTSSDGKNLTAPTALWLRDSEEVYFPDGYLLQAAGMNQEGMEAVFIIDQNGHLLQSDKAFPQNLSGLDWLDEAEATFNNLLFEELIRHFSALGELFPEPLVPLLPSPPSLRRGGDSIQQDCRGRLEVNGGKS